MLDALSLKNTKLGLETLELMGCDPSMIRMVLNRAQSQVGISQSDVMNVLGREPDVMIPSDREIPRAVNEGVPITLAKPSSETAAAFRKLASFYHDGGIVEMPQAHAGSTRKSIFGRKR
jgi:Flp pilus assembly CpaE family ATPase